MRTSAIIVALSVAAPSLAQNTSPFQGPMANTIVLDGGWQMTPQADRCTLTHRGRGAGQDLVIVAPKGQDQVLLGTIVAARSAYTRPVQLTVTAQAGQPRQIGQVTFKPETGALGTLLMGPGPQTDSFPGSPARQAWPSSTLRIIS